MSYLTAEKKRSFSRLTVSQTPTGGSAESQVALFSYRIIHLTEHLKKNNTTFGTRARC